ncbi:TPA: ATP-binding cassette domain-containing protein [Salmonella enterica subsp. enterica serovar Virchow]
MSLISMHGAWLSFSDAPLLDNAELHIEDNERVCLVGRNGAGKSTLMKILNREQGLDDGRIIYEQDLIVARLQQDPPRNIAGSVYDFVAEGIEEQAEYLKRYHEISRLVMTDPSEKNLNEMARVQEQLDHHNLWQLENRINEVLEQLGLDPNAALSSLSGGWLRKAALGRALVSNPRVLLLDEPTNHLDIETIDWLEGFLKTFNGTIIFISHDRSFIRNMATRIVDLDRGKLVTYPGNYDQYLLEKEEALRVEELQNAEFDRKLAQEEVWIRQGIKARRTRNEGRVRALKAMRRERSERREVMGTAKMQVEEATRSGKIVFEMENVDYQVEGKQLVKDFSAQVQRGGKIGRYIGGYHDARAQQEQHLATKQPMAKKNEEVIAPKAEIVKRGSSKLSYKLQRELEQLPGQLEDLEAKLEALQAQVADAAFFSQPHEQTQKVLADLSQAEQELEQAFERWEYLEGLKNGA